nr:MAG: hypothetical protein 2 [Barnaviridae sp.]
MSTRGTPRRRRGRGNRGRANGFNAVPGGGGAPRTEHFRALSDVVKTGTTDGLVQKLEISGAVLAGLQSVLAQSAECCIQQLIVRWEPTLPSTTAGLLYMAVMPDATCVPSSLVGFADVGCQPVRVTSKAARQIGRGDGYVSVSSVLSVVGFAFDGAPTGTKAGRFWVEGNIMLRGAP